MTPGQSDDAKHAYVGLAAYFPRITWNAPQHAEKLASLFLDARWAWPPWWVAYSGKHKRDDRGMVRFGGKAGMAPMLEGLSSKKLSTLYIKRARGDGDFANVSLDVDHEKASWDYETPYEMLIVYRCSDLPTSNPFSSWIPLAHELVASVGALNATLGVWPTRAMALGDTWLIRTVIDTPKGDFSLGLPANFEEQTSLLAKWIRYRGRTYARHPRWGTYLNAAHLAAIGGVERVQAEVAPAVITPLGELTYLQLTPSIETAMSPEAEQKRQALEALMAPILLGAPRPTPTSPPASP